MNKAVVLVSGILKNDKDQILLLLRGGKNKTNKGNWQLPEGKVEFGEQPDVALKREIKEEIGMDVVSSQILFPFSSVIEALGEKHQIIRLIYKVNCEGEGVHLDEDHDDYKWFSVLDIQRIEKTVDGLKEIVAKL